MCSQRLTFFCGVYRELSEIQSKRYVGTEDDKGTISVLMKAAAANWQECWKTSVRAEKQRKKYKKAIKDLKVHMHALHTRRCACLSATRASTRTHAHAHITRTAHLFDHRRGQARTHPHTHIHGYTIMCEVHQPSLTIPCTHSGIFPTQPARRKTSRYRGWRAHMDARARHAHTPLSLAPRQYCIGMVPVHTTG